jgi:hypothetical protein
MPNTSDAHPVLQWRNKGKESAAKRHKRWQSVREYTKHDARMGACVTKKSTATRVGPRGSRDAQELVERLNRLDANVNALASRQ